MGLTTLLAALLATLLMALLAANGGMDKIIILLLLSSWSVVVTDGRTDTHACNTCNAHAIVRQSDTPSETYVHRTVLGSHAHQTLG